ncbi:MAG: TauD/TfdA family dioxygenase [Pseudomonadota bacterium]
MTTIVPSQMASSYVLFTAQVIIYDCHIFDKRAAGFRDRAIEKRINYCPMSSEEIKFEPLHGDFGARVVGMTMAESIPRGLAQKIEDALNEFSLLVFPEQAINDAIHFALTKSLGEPEPNHLSEGATGEVNYFGTIGNVIDADTQKGNDDALTKYLSGNYMWHTDSSFRKVPSKYSINHAYEVPGEGGDTLFVSTRAAYERLSEDKKNEINRLTVLHDYVFSRSQVASVNPNHAANFMPVRHKLVQTNPRNGKKNFYVGSHARGICEYPGVEARRLIDELLSLSTREQDIYTHHWAVGDTVIWDNRCILHRGSGYDADRWRRLMRQTRVSGEGANLTE